MTNKIWFAYNPTMNANDLIDKLGGTSEVARMCEIKPASVSEWRQKGEIPKARLMYLKLLRPEIFTQEQTESEQ